MLAKYRLLDMAQRVTLRKRQPYNTSSNRRRVVKTPGGKLVYHTSKNLLQHLNAVTAVLLFQASLLFAHANMQLSQSVRRRCSVHMVVHDVVAA